MGVGRNRTRDSGVVSLWSLTAPQVLRKVEIVFFSPSNIKKQREKLESKVGLGEVASVSDVMCWGDCCGVLMD